MNARLTVFIAMALAAAAMLASCGDDESTESANSGAGGAGETSEAGGGSSAGGGTSLETSSLDQEEYVKRASAACAKQRESLLKEFGEYAQEHRDEVQSEVALFPPLIKKVMLPIVEREIAAVRALGAPEGDEETIEAILVAEEEAVAEVAKAKNLKSFEDVYKHFGDANRMYRDYGFTGCINSE